MGQCFNKAASPEESRWFNDAIRYLAFLEEAAEILNEKYSIRIAEVRQSPARGDKRADVKINVIQGTATQSFDFELVDSGRGELPGRFMLVRPDGFFSPNDHVPGLETGYDIYNTRGPSAVALIVDLHGNFDVQLEKEVRRFKPDPLSLN